MKKLVILGSFLLIMSFAFQQANADELRTYYNQNVPYKAFFVKSNPQKIKVQKTTSSGKVVQAVVPAHIVNTKEEDKTQKQEKKDK